MPSYLVYIINILAIALPVALFEITIEKNKGWGSGWRKDKWYAKPFAARSRLVEKWAKLIHIEHPLNYHFLVFTVIIPLIFIGELILGAGNFLVLLAAFIAVLVCEDFFWFLFNWHFPGSLRELLKGPNGSIWWHKDWTRIAPNSYLPTSYFPALVVSVALLVVTLIA